MEALANIKIGTCAWTHDDWRGTFYPEHFPAEERLAYYARYFPGVEVDSTFYHAPAEHVVAHWAERTPAHFAFSCKMPQEITHQLRLRDAEGPLQAFLSALKPLGQKLWCVLVQLPPSFRPQRDESTLRAFVRQLPGDVRFAFEFRHPTWHQPRIANLLKEHGMTWVWNDLTSLEHQKEGAFEFQPDTADFVYARLMGDMERKHGEDSKKSLHFQRLLWPRDSAMESWSIRLRQAMEEHRRIFVAVSNHFEGYAPQTVRRLAQRLGLSYSLPDLAAIEEKAVTAPDPQMDLL